MAGIFGEGKIFLKLPRVQCLDALWVENFDEIALSRMVKEIEANLCFAIFGKNWKIQNGRHFWGGEFFFLNCQEYDAQIPYGSKISTKSVYLARLRRYEHVCLFQYSFAFFSIAKSTFLRYPVGRKFGRNRSISHG